MNVDSKPGVGAKLRKWMGVAALGLAGVTPAAHAVLITETINFNNIANGTFNGVNLAVGTGLGFHYGPPPFGALQQAVDIGGGNIVMVDGNRFDSNGAAATLTRIGGGLFSVLSIDIADLTGNPGGGGGFGGLSGSGFRIGVDPGGFSFSPNSAAFSTITLNLLNTGAFYTNIVSGGSSDNFAIDNIVVQYDNGVPEPASLALFGLGLAAFGFARRKKA